MVNKGSKCPNCGERQLVPIAYGFPSPHVMEQSDQGVVVLGGCIMSADDPSFVCKVCQHSVWRDGRTQLQLASH